MKEPSAWSVPEMSIQAPAFISFLFLFSHVRFCGKGNKTIRQLFSVVAVDISTVSKIDEVLLSDTY